MTKWIKSLIEKVFGKFCKCEEPIILEDEEKYLTEEKAQVPIATRAIREATVFIGI